MPTSPPSSASRQLVLGSTSPYRRELLARLRVDKGDELHALERAGKLIRYQMAEDFLHLQPHERARRAMEEAEQVAAKLGVTMRMSLDERIALTAQAAGRGDVAALMESGWVTMDMVPQIPFVAEASLLLDHGDGRSSALVTSVRQVLPGHARVLGTDKSGEDHTVIRAEVPVIGREEEARDIVQETFLRAFRSLAQCLLDAGRSLGHYFPLVRISASLRPVGCAAGRRWP